MSIITNGPIILVLIQAGGGDTRGVAVFMLNEKNGDPFRCVIAPYLLRNSGGPEEVV